MEELEFKFHPGKQPGCALSWQHGVYRFHVWVDRDGAPAETIFRDAIVGERKPRTVRLPQARHAEGVH